MPVLVQQAVVDKVTGLTAAQAITAALFERTRTGRGQVIEIPMLHAGLAFLWPDVSTNISMVGDFDKLPAQSRTFRLTPTADGHVAMITVTTPQWDGLLRAVGRDELVGSPDLDTPQKRGRNSAGLMKEIAAYLATLPSDDVVARLSEQRRAVRQGRRRSRSSPTWSKRPRPATSCVRCTPSSARCCTRGPAVTFDEEVVIRPAPAIGEHTAEILAELDDNLTESGARRRHRSGLGEARWAAPTAAHCRARGVRPRRRARSARFARVLRPDVLPHGRDDARGLAPDRDTGEAGAEPRQPGDERCCPATRVDDER